MLVTVGILVLLTACSDENRSAEEPLVDEFVELAAQDRAERGITEAQDRCLAQQLLASLGEDRFKQYMAMNELYLEQGGGDDAGEEFMDYALSDDGSVWGAVTAAAVACYGDAGESATEDQSVDPGTLTDPPDDPGAAFCEVSIANLKDSLANARRAAEEMEAAQYVGAGDPWDVWRLYKEAVREASYASQHGVSAVMGYCVLTEEEERGFAASQAALADGLQTLLNGCPELVRELQLDLRLGGCDDLRDAWDWQSPS